MEIKPNSNGFNRKAAFTMQLVNPESDKPDAVYTMLILQGHSICFLENSIAEVLPAEIIDPDNKEPDTRPSYQFKYSIGSRNPTVARTILQANDVLGSISLNSGLNKQEILDHIWICTQYLINCENSYHEMCSDTTKLMFECDKIASEGKTASCVPSLPQVKDLEQRVGTFLGNGKRFLEKSHELLCIFYGCTSNATKFHRYRKWMADHKADKTKIISMLEQDKDWIQLLARYRNAHDINHFQPNFNLVIENFKHRAGNKFTCPSFRYDFSRDEGEVQNEPCDLIREMDVLINNMLEFFEELFLLCAKDNWDDLYNYEILQHEKEDINAKCPILYYISRKQK